MSEQSVAELREVWGPELERRYAALRGATAALGEDGDAQAADMALMRFELARRDMSGLLRLLAPAKDMADGLEELADALELVAAALDDLRDGLEA
jgi:hypothetical protein